MLLHSNNKILGCNMIQQSEEIRFRYPKWAHSYENSLSFEIKTRQSNGLILYTDDSDVNGNFYAISINDGHIQLDFRLVL